MNLPYFDDSSYSPNTPVTPRDFVCTLSEPTRIELTDVTQADPALRYTVVILTRPANEATKLRQKVKITTVMPALIDDGLVTEYIDLAIVRLEIEVPSSWSFTNRGNISLNYIGKLLHIANMTDVVHILKYGYAPC